MSLLAEGFLLPQGLDAHQRCTRGLPLLARIVAERAHGQTGIDIHPGARIGPAFSSTRAPVS